MTPQELNARSWPYKAVITTDYEVVSERQPFDLWHFLRFLLIAAWLGLPIGLVAGLLDANGYLP